jgi:hypothetical protein
MGVACYKPKPGKDAALMALMKTHLPRLRAEGLVNDGLSLCGKAADGTFVEVFCWKSHAAIETAHSNPAVQKMWGEYVEVCDYKCIGDVPEAKQLFASYTPVNLVS